jgi:hypothetical protein
LIFLHGSLADLGATFVFDNNVAGLFASAIRDVPCNGFGMFACSVVIRETYADGSSSLWPFTMGKWKRSIGPPVGYQNI